MNEDFIKAIKNQGIVPPIECSNSFEKKFKGSTGLEWYNADTNFEAIFYKDNLEHIALFRNDGHLIEYRRKVPQGFLPHRVRQFVMEKGEIMNRVLLNRGNEILYEIIYRDSDNRRFMILLTDLGVIKEQKEL